MTLRAAIAGVLIAAAPLIVIAQGRGGGGQGRGTGPGGGRGIGPGRAGPAAQRPPVVFRSGVTLVQLDAIVTDAQGTPVKGLTAADFEVFEGGEPREVATFAAVDIPVDLPVGLPDDDTTEPDVRTNVAPPGRTYLIAFDEVSPEYLLPARNIVRRFIGEHLGPNDVAAVALTGRGLSTSGQDFTGSRRLILNAIDKFSGGFSTFEGVAGSDPRQLASGLRKLTEFLATLPGRKTLLFVAEGVSGIDFFDVVDYKGGALTPAAIDAHEAVAAATRGNVTIYPVDPRGLTPGLTPLGTRTDMTALADVTGGFAITDTNNLGEAFARIVRENSTYYTIGFNSENQRLDGRFVRVEVRAKRPGLQVRTRNGYVAPLGNERRPEPVEGDTRLQAVKDALASATSARGLPIRVFAAPYKASGDKSTIAIAVEIDVSALGQQTQDGGRTGDIEISYLATDASGKVRPGRRHTANVAVKGDAANKGRRQEVRLLSQFELADGRYQLRVAAGSATSAGSVVYDLEVPDFTKGPLALSGVSLTSTAAAAVSTLKPHDPLADVLPAPPTAAREFAGTDELVLFAEVYDNRKDGQGTIEFSTAISTEQGRILRAPNPESRAATAPRRKSGGHGFVTRLPLGGLSPGAYVILIEAHSGGADGPTVSRRVPIRVR